MKITDHDVIKNSEQELIDAITADLDWGTIEKIIKKEHNLEIEENIEYKKGDMVVYNDQVAYKLEFNVNVILSVLLDREGNYISVESSGSLGTSQNIDIVKDESKDSYESVLSEFDSTPTTHNDNLTSAMSKDEIPQEKISKTASQAEEMISKIENETEITAEKS